jgi:sugar O-acyltransferase (sialic acid O-acetyltransferase NeuD family)
MNKPVIVFGCSQISEMVYYDSKNHEDFEIAVFTVDTNYLMGKDTFLGLPLIDFAAIKEEYPPEEFDMILLYTGFQEHSTRDILYRRIKEKGYIFRSYVSSRADYDGPRKMGENNVIMAGAHVGIRGVMGDNNLIRQHVYLGHDFRVGSHCVVSPGCCIGSKVDMKDNCYLGLNATVINVKTIGKKTMIGAGAVVIQDTEPYSRHVGNPSRVIGYHKEEEIRMVIERE